MEPQKPLPKIPAKVSEVIQKIIALLHDHYRDPLGLSRGDHYYWDALNISPEFVKVLKKINRYKDYLSDEFGVNPREKKREVKADKMGTEIFG